MLYLYMYICEIIRVYSHPIRIAYFLYFFWGYIDVLRVHQRAGVLPPTIRNALRYICRGKLKEALYSSEFHC